jgi:hypothetical protein
MEDGRAETRPVVALLSCWTGPGLCPAESIVRVWTDQIKRCACTQHSSLTLGGVPDPPSEAGDGPVQPGMVQLSEEGYLRPAHPSVESKMLV